MNNNGKVVAFGELMLRLTPPGAERFVQADRFEAVYGGGEANVAVSCSNFGLDTEFVTRLPAHEIGQAAVNELRRYGVGTGWIRRGGDRIGLYYHEKGASQRPSKVIYDRAGSALAEAEPSEFDWEKILDGAGWFHFSGITPALSDNAAQIVLEAAKAAKKLGVTVSMDINYRKNLWSLEKASGILTGLAPYVDVCLGIGEAESRNVFGLEPQGETAVERFANFSRELAKKYGFKTTAVTFREAISANDNKISGLIYDAASDSCHASRKYDMHIVDRVGGGDAFASGLIYALITGRDPGEAVEYAAAASCLKHTIEGDVNLVSAEEVETLAHGDGSGSIRR